MSEKEENKDLSEEQLEEEEDEESEKENKTKSKQNIEKTRTYYLSVIEKLQTELEYAKNLNCNTKKTLLQEEQEKLNYFLNEKTTIIEKLKSTNIKQKKALYNLSKRLEQLNTQNEKIVEEDINEVKSNEKGKIKSEEDKKLDKNINTLKKLRLKNEILFNMIYENREYADIVNLEEYNKEIKEQLGQKNDEKNILTKQLKSHLSCKEREKQLNEEINILTKELKDLKSNIQKIKDKTDELTLKNTIKKSNPFFSFNNSKKIIKVKKLNNSATSKHLNIFNNSTPDARSNKTFRHNYKNINLPLIQPKKEESVLTNELSNRIKESFKGNENEFNSLFKKIKIVETKRKKTENRNKKELDEKNMKLNSLDEKFNIMMMDNNYSEFTFLLLKNKLNEIILKNKQKEKQLKELEKELHSKTQDNKNKSHEIKKLLLNIKKMRGLASLCQINIEDNNIKEYIDKIKKEKEINSLKINSKEDNNGDNKILNNINKQEENIQQEILKNIKKKKKKKKKRIKKNDLI